MCRGCVALFVVLVLGAPMRADDLKKIEGTWVVVSVNVRGQDEKELVGRKLTFAKGKVTLQEKQGTEPKKGVFKIDETTTPRQIDITPEEEPRPLRGIYALDGDMLKICLGDGPDEERPTKFETAADRKVVLLVLKRDKP
jgi:uncharacterized protein (TIGR03067 family)